MIRGYFDGCGSLNQKYGPAGCGAVIYSENKLIWRRAVPLTAKSSIEAEYAALTMLVDELASRGARGVEIFGDCMPVIKQVKGEWSINRWYLFEYARPIMESIKSRSMRLEWIPRKLNKEADRLSKLARKGFHV